MPGYQFFRHKKRHTLTYLATGQAVYLSEKELLLRIGFALEPKGYVQADDPKGALAVFTEINAAEDGLALTQSIEEMFEFGQGLLNIARQG